jgi:hypothetical protein
MRKLTASVLLFLIAVVPAWGDQPAGRLVEETRYAARLGSETIGSSHTTVREVDRNGTKVFVTTIELKLNIRRAGQVSHYGMETGSEENAEGKVSKVWMKQYLEGQLTLRLDGVVKGSEIEISVEGPNPSTRSVPWDDQVIGLYRQEKIFQDKKAKSGDKFSFATFEPVFSGILTHQITVEDYEELAMPGGKKQRLLRVQEVPDKVQAGQKMIQLPGSSNWLDKNLRVACTEVEMPLIGKMRLYRTDSKDIRLGAAPELLAFIPLDRAINRPNDTRSAVYSITLKGEQNPGTAFASDDRQEAKNANGHTFELHVRASSGPQAVDNPGLVSDDYLKSCFYIDSDDALVQKRARQAVGNEADPWAKAKRIERWVRQNMNVSFSRDFCAASAVAKRPSGDCRQHAILAAAMCRAVGVPSRTAIGLVYAVEHGKPGMFFHMWTEVWVDGQWLALDATRGEGHVGATHLKITDSSWHNETSLRPLLPVLRVTDKDKLSVKVVRVDYAD